MLLSRTIQRTPSPISMLYTVVIKLFLLDSLHRVLVWFPLFMQLELTLRIPLSSYGFPISLLSP